METKYGLQQKLKKEKEQKAAITAANENKILKQENETLKKENADLQKKIAQLEKQIKEESKDGTGGKDNSSGTGASETKKTN